MGAAAADEASVELIADGVHVDAGFTRLVFAVAAPGRVVLVTDATAAAGMADGDYVLAVFCSWEPVQKCSVPSSQIAGSG